MPTMICTRISSDTTQKYLMVARCDGVGTHLPERVRRGQLAVVSSCFCEAYHQTMPQIPASSMMMLTPVHITLSPVGLLPTSGSCGQLLV